MHLIEACHEAEKLDLLHCSSGNLSARSSDYITITESGLWLGKADEYSFVYVDLKTGRKLNKEDNPSSELDSHLAIYRNTKSNAVLHCQPPSLTTLACIENIEDYIGTVIPEQPFYIGRIGFVDYLPPSKRLAKRIGELSKYHKLIIMKNHGIICHGDSLKEVIQIAYFGELMAKIQLPFIIESFTSELKDIPTKEIMNLMKLKTTKGKV